MNNFLFEDPIVELKDVTGSDSANNLIKQGWLCIGCCSTSQADGNDIYSEFKYSLALTKSVKNNLLSKSTEPKATYSVKLDEDM